MIATDQALEGGSIPAAFSGSMQPHSRRAKCTKRPLSEASCEKPPPFQTHAVLGFLPRAHRDSDSDRGSRIHHDARPVEDASKSYSKELPGITEP